MCGIIPESSFQFTSPVLSCFEFGLNEAFAPLQDKQVQTQIRMGVSVKQNSDSPEANVALTVEVGEKDGNSPFYIHAVESAVFRWGDDINNEMVKRLLNQNAPSLLLSYLRPVIVQVTSASPYGVCNIPFVNFTQFTQVTYE